MCGAALRSTKRIHNTEQGGEVSMQGILPYVVGGAKRMTKILCLRGRTAERMRINLALTQHSCHQPQSHPVWL